MEEEIQLASHLANHPTDWESRLALAERYFSQEAHDLVADLFRHAPVPPDSQQQTHRAVELTAGGDLSGLNAVLSGFAAAHSGDAWAHHVYARILAHQHLLDEARAEYQWALSLDSTKQDVELERILNHSDSGEEESLLPDPEDPPGEFVGKTFMVALGNAVKPQEREPDDREKIRALITAVVVHVVMLVGFAFVVVATHPVTSPQITAVSVHSVDEDSLSKERAKKAKTEILETSDSRVEVNLDSLSLISAPEFNAQIDPVGQVGAGNFGSSMSFSKKSGGGGEVSFFGSKTKARRVVFVVDFSASMIGDKEQLMRQELSKSVKALPNTVEFALIFFSGPSWYAGQTVGKAEKLGEFIGNTVSDGRNQYVWYEGWDEKGRHTGVSGKTALYHYADGPDRLPPGKYMVASGKNIRDMLQIIEETPLVFGTDWRWPLRMAMNMEPDVIYFMTDGAFGVGRGVTKQEMVSNLLAYNREHGNAKINTICMKVLTARIELEQLAQGSGGEFTLIKGDGTVVRGTDLK